MSAKIIPITKSRTVKDRLIEAVGTVLARDGFNAANSETVAREAGMHAAAVHRRFGGLAGLVAAFGYSESFWPTIDELVGDDMDLLKRMTPGELMAAFFKRYLVSMLKRPKTLEILAWELRERNELSKLLEDVRVRTALEFFELMQGEVPENVDLTAVVALMASAVAHLAVRSRNTRTFGGIDLESELGRKRIESAVDVLMKSTLDTCPETSTDFSKNPSTDSSSGSC